ncbi:RNA repair transcriptional activator RtcR family protein [Archangium sp.]|nr:RNA repair transcriptional activator RtcR family protein [Archangium sp.]HYO51740.1 RNA repair transcriptional activator RtcR family protein [Archangium sp.]
MRPTELDIQSPWDLEETYGALLDYAKASPAVGSRRGWATCSGVGLADV